MTNNLTRGVDVDESTQTKPCTKCGAVKSLEDFRLEPRVISGRRSWCRACDASYVREVRARDPKRLARRVEAARMQAAQVKFCRGCEAERPFDDFAQCAESPDGLDPRCKDCNNKYMREFYARNLEERRAISREKSRKLWETEARREYARKWQLDNRERSRANYRARMAVDPSKELEKSMRRRARLLGATVGEVDRKLLWVRQCGICSLCAERIDASIAWPDPFSKSIDHIIPLSKGGAHSQSNVSWTHLRCNIVKGARLPEAS